MQVQHTEVCRTDPNCELCEGMSSWDGNKKSLKYGWFTSNGSRARGGEFPIEATPQFVEMAVRLGRDLKLLDANGNPIPGGEFLTGLLQAAIRSGCKLSFA